MTITNPLPVGLGSTETARADLSEGERTRLDADIRALEAGLAVWAGTPLGERAELLTRLHAAVAAQAEHWALTARDIKGLDPDSPLVGEEWISGPYATLAGIGALAHTDAALAAGQSPLARRRSSAPRRATGSRCRCCRSPATRALLLHGFRGEVWLKPGVTATRRVRAAGLGQRDPDALRRCRRSCSAPATSPRSRRWTCCTSSSPTTGPCCSSSTRSWPT